MKRSSTLKPLYYSVIALTCIAIFLLWVISVFLPITLIELRYQYKHTLSGLFKLPDYQGARAQNSITIPKLFINEPIIFNVDPNNKTKYLAALKNGIAHASGTSFPGDGGQGYYFAHSSTPTFVRQFNAVFYLIHKLEVNDTIYIFRDQKRYGYSVYAKQITAAEDTAFLRYNNPVETIVLQTCWPPGTTAQRLLVFAKRIP